MKKMVEIKLTEDQKLQMEENETHLHMAQALVNQLYSEDKETFLINTLQQLNDDLYLLVEDLKELNENGKTND